MKNKDEQQRILAVQRFRDGEKPESICASLGKSRAWLYKWLKRQEHHDNEEPWCKDSSRRPKNCANRTPDEIEEIVKIVRLSLYNKEVFCGAQAILWELEDMDISPLPSLRTINRILARNELTHRRTGRYSPKGTPYPALPSAGVNDTHQADLVGPCCLKGPIRFYSLNVVDLATARCGAVPLGLERSAEHHERPLGYLETSGYSGQSPGGQYLRRQSQISAKHGASYPPLPAQRNEPKKGKYHFVRLIRSDLRPNIFGESFSVPPELEFEYTVATIDVKEQKLTISHDGKPVKQIE